MQRGHTKNHEKHGQGSYIYSIGDKYVGEYKYGKKNGKGFYTFANGNNYLGEFKDHKKHGQGSFTFVDGTIEEGIWENDKFISVNKSNPNPKIEGYKSFCSEIGFIPGTEKFGECVVDVMKKG